MRNFFLNFTSNKYNNYGTKNSYYEVQLQHF